MGTKSCKYSIIFLLLAASVFAGMDAKDGKVINVAICTDGTDSANKNYHDDPDNIPVNYTRGSIIYGNNSTWAELTIGANNYFLISDGTDVAWTDINADGILDHTLTALWADIQGGTTDEYYHLTAAEWTELTEWIDDVTLYDDGDMDLDTHHFNSTGDVRADRALFGGVGYARGDVAPPPPAGGTGGTGVGSELDPYLVETYAHLQAMNDNLGWYYKQVATIDGDGETAFVTIGTSSTPFTGQFDGNGYKIQNVIVNTSGSGNRGFIGYANGATVLNTVLEDWTVGGSFDQNIGVMVGFAKNSTFTDCFTSGVTYTGTGLDCGGFCGEADGNVTFTRCGTTATVDIGNTASDQLGGFIGAAQDNVDFIDCYARGAVGAFGQVVNTTGRGGFVGWSTDSSSVSFTRCYAAGAVPQKGNSGYEQRSGRRTKQGFIGMSIDYLQTYTDCYWDSEATLSNVAGPGRPEVQKTGMTGDPTSGTYTIHFDGKSTVIQWNDTWSSITSKLEADHGVGEILTYNVTYPSQDNFDDNSDLELIFQGSLEGTDVAMISFTDNLVGGTIGSPSEYRTAIASLDATDGMNAQTTAEMKTQSTFTNWDFTNVWVMTEGSTYPMLRDASGNPTEPGGTPSGSTEIHTFGTTVALSPVSVADNADNVLIEGDLEVQGTTLSAASAAANIANITTDYVQLDTTYTDGTSEGRLQWNIDDGTPEIGMPGGNVNLQIGQEMLIRVTNAEVSTITNGTPVYASGASGTNIEVKEADADFTLGLGFRTIGVATEDIAAGQKGFVATQGFVRDIDTDSFAAAGVPAYLAVGGGLTATPPTPPDVRYVVGVVTKKHATEGEIYVSQTSIPNLNSLSDVLVTAPSDNDILEWNTGNYWENTSTPTFDEIIDNGLTASLGVYTDGSKQLTSTAPSTGVLGHWDRTGTVLSPSNSGDDLDMSGNDILNAGAGPDAVIRTVNSKGSRTGLQVVDGPGTPKDFSIWRLFNKDNTERFIFQLWTDLNDEPALATAYSLFNINYDNTVGAEGWEIYPSMEPSGSRLLRFEALNAGSLNTDQLVLKTSGDVSMANDVYADSFVAGFTTYGSSSLTSVTSPYTFTCAGSFIFNDDILMNGTEELRFNTSLARIYSPSSGNLIIDASQEVQIDTSLLDINASNTSISGPLSVDGSYTSTSGDIDVGGGIAAGTDASISSSNLNIFRNTDSSTGDVTNFASRLDATASSNSSGLKRTVFGNLVTNYSGGTHTGIHTAIEGQYAHAAGTLTTEINSGVQSTLNMSGGSTEHFAYFNGYELTATGTITNQYGLLLSDIDKGTNNYAIKTGAGAVDFGDTLDVAGVTTLQGITQPPVDGDTGDIVVQTGVNTLEIKTPTVDVPVVLSMYDAEPSRGSETNWCGGMLSLATAQPLDSAPTDLAVTKGIGKLLIIVNAGSDISGSITITGESIDRETGASTPADTDSITVDTLTTDTSDTDTNGNIRHAFTNAYISSKWFTGSVTLSTTDLTLTDVDVFHISFEQFNDQPNIVLDTFDANLYTLNVNAEFDAYLFSVHVTGSKATIERHADLNIGADGETAIVNKYWRLRRGNLNDAIDGTTDGVWVDVHYSNSPSYIEDVTLKLWATETRSLTLN
jgi:hypothetical protein